MFDHTKYLAKFLREYKAGVIGNNSVARIAPTLSKPAYKIIGIHHLRPDENVGKRNLFLEVVDAEGNRLNEKIKWGWEGQYPSQHPNPVVLDKPLNEPAGNISIDWGQKIWAEVLGKESDRVYGVTTQLPGEGDGNSLGHHSYYCVWMWAEVDVVLPEPEPDCSELQQRYDALLHGLRLIKDALKDL